MQTRDDLGDMPLLQRGPSQHSEFSGHAMGSPAFPGGFAGPAGYDPALQDDEQETNIRYGRIPQRVPRRYKTIKKVECASDRSFYEMKIFDFF